MFDFTKVIENAQKAPEAPANQSPIPDVFSSQAMKGLLEPPVESIDKIPNVHQYDFLFNSARLQIGKEQVDFVNGQAIYEHKDDSERLKEIMDKCLAGKAILNKKVESFLKDGTVVLWLEWLEPKLPAPQSKKGPVLSAAELVSPEILTRETSEEDGSNNNPYPDFSSAESD